MAESLKETDNLKKKKNLTMIFCQKFFNLHMLDEFFNKYLLAFLKIITIRAMKLNVQTFCMAQKCLMLRTKPPIYADEWNISKDFIITCN